VEGDRQTRWTRRTAVLAAAIAGGGVLPLADGTVASADETHASSHNGPNVTLVSTGQIDDPLEDVLEHAAVFR
jgi:hypothetical protein